VKQISKSMNELILHWCSHCKQLGHYKNECSYNTVYDTLIMFPRDIINLIFDFKCSLEYKELRKQYFQCKILPELRYILSLLQSTIIIRDKLKLLLDNLKETVGVRNRIDVITKILNIYVDFSWLIDKDPDVSRLKVVVQIALKRMFYVDTWTNASIYHKLLYNSYLTHE